MTAFVRELADTDWYTCRVTGVVDALKGMDAKTVKAMNGTAGSSHAPAAAIVIGGSGMVAAGLWEFSGVCTTGPGKHIELGAGHAADYLRLGASHVGAYRSIRVRLLPSAADGYGYVYAPLGDPTYLTTRFPGTRFLIPLTPHDGSVLETVGIYFAINYVARPRVPNVPKYRVIRVDSSGNVEALHTSRSGLYVDDGFLPLPPNISTVLDYDNAGVPYPGNTYTTNQNNVVDLAKYAYFVDFIEEDGDSQFTPDVTATNGAGTVIQGVNMACSAISNMRPQ